MRSLADKGWSQPPPIKFSPFRGLLVLLGVAWLLLTVWLFNYYWENSGLKVDNNPDHLVDGHYQMDRQEASTYGLGLTLLGPTNGIDPGIMDLMALRQAEKSGSMSEQALALERIRQQVQASDNEAYRTTWSPVLSCVNSGCDNGVYLQAAAEMAARQPRWVGHALIIEANYWHQARISGDSNAAASAVARLDQLVRTYGGSDLKRSWTAVEACGGTCPVFDELLLDFVAQATRN